VACGGAVYIYHVEVSESQWHGGFKIARRLNDDDGFCSVCMRCSLWSVLYRICAPFSPRECLGVYAILPVSS
jgi:hypothetical protein